MLLTVGVVLYGVVALLCVRPVAGHCAWYQRNHWWEHQKGPDAIDWFAGLIVGLLIGAIWPLAAFALILGPRLPFPQMPKIGEERAAQQKADLERLRRMERELGLEK